MKTPNLITILLKLTIIGALSACFLISSGAAAAQTSNEVTGITRITGLDDGDDRSPMWSPDGSELVYDQQTAVYTINPDGTGKQLLFYGSDLPDAGEFTLAYYPCWSPDGKTIVFTSDAGGSDLDIWLWTMGKSIEAPGLYNTDEWELKWAWGGYGWFLKITDDAVDDWFPRWGPSGLLFSSYDENIVGIGWYTDNTEIFLNSHATQLTNNTVGDLEPAWSLDGSKIAFTSQDDIWVMNADGSGLQKLTTWAGSDSSPSWSPDGTKIVYVSSSRTTPWNEIWVMNADGTNPTVLIDNAIMGSGGHCMAPAWGPDGTKIAFVWENAQTYDDDIYIAEVNLGVSVPTGSKSVYVLASQGGAAVFENVMVEIPADALPQNTTVTITKTSATAPSGCTIVSSVYELGPSGTTFSTPVTITIPYDEASLPAGFDESQLAIYVKSDGDWQVLQSQVDQDNNEVCASVGHFSQYAVLAGTGVGPGGIGDILGILGYIGPIPVIVLIIVIIAILVVVGVVAKAKRSK